jgi:hypothetical protein
MQAKFPDWEVLLAFSQKALEILAKAPPHPDTL